MVDWKSHAPADGVKTLKEAKTEADFARAARFLSFAVLTSIAKKKMSPEAARKYDVFRARMRSQQVQRQNFSDEETAFDQVDRKITALVDSAVIRMDRATGGYGQQATEWAETHLQGLADKFHDWWND
jgi:hypothetical protein